MKNAILICLFAFLVNQDHSFAQVTLGYEWSKSFGSIDWDDTGDMATDAEGNIYIVGVYSGTTDFDPGVGIAELTCLGYTDVFFAKYSPDGNYIWAKSVGGIGSEIGTNISTDVSGNVYISGYFYGTFDANPGPAIDTLSITGLSDLFFAKYDSDGNYLWANDLGMVGLSYSNGMDVNEAGEIILSGTFQSAIDLNANPGAADYKVAVSMEDAFIVKYTTNGVYVWGAHIGGSGNQEDRVVRLDAVGNIFITGWHSGTTDFDPSIGVANLTSAGGRDVFIAKYDPVGTYIWAKNIGGTANNNMKDMTIDAVGNIFICGYFEGTMDVDPSPLINNIVAIGDIDGYLAKYDSDGNYNWCIDIGSALKESSVNSILTDAAGNIYILGASSGSVDMDPGAAFQNLPSDGIVHALIASYSNNGLYRWSNSFTGDYSIGMNMHIDANGFIYPCITFEGTINADFGANIANHYSSGERDVFIGKYSQSAVGIEFLSTNALFLPVFFDSENDRVLVTLKSLKETRGELSIRSTSGQVIYSKQFSQFSEDLSIDATRWPDAVYIITAHTEEATLSNRVIIKKN